MLLTETVWVVLACARTVDLRITWSTAVPVLDDGSIEPWW